MNINSESMKCVNFLVCGTQKGGTSALFEYLREHPNICMADKKEVHYFDNEKNFLNGKPDYLVYHSFFKPNTLKQLLGEATPIYMYWYEAPKRIWEYNPDMKILVVLRNPIERAFSHWNMEKLRNYETLDFYDAIINEAKRCREALPYQHRLYSYVNRGFYLDQLRRIWTYFPKRQVHVLRSEDLKQQPKKTLDDIFEFLNLPPLRDIKRNEVFAHSYENIISDRELYYLMHLFEFEIKALERELSWDCSEWFQSF